MTEATDNEIEEEENAEELKLGPIFSRPDAICLANSEANLVLEGVLHLRKQENPSYVASPMVQQTKEYLERFSSVKKQATAGEMRTLLADEAGMKNFEIAAVMNLMPSRADEAKALVPSLETVEDRFPDEEYLQQILDNLATIRDL